jgi:hypothetical protein
MTKKAKNTDLSPAYSTAKPKAELMRALRARRKEQGLVCLHLWTRPENLPEILALNSKLLGGNHEIRNPKLDAGGIVDAITDTINAIYCRQAG